MMVGAIMKHSIRFFVVIIALFGAHVPVLAQEAPNPGPTHGTPDLGALIGGDQGSTPRPQQQPQVPANPNQFPAGPAMPPNGPAPSYIREIYTVWPPAGPPQPSYGQAPNNYPPNGNTLPSAVAGGSAPAWARPNVPRRNAPAYIRRIYIQVPATPPGRLVDANRLKDLSFVEKPGTAPAGQASATPAAGAARKLDAAASVSGPVTRDDDPVATATTDHPTEPAGGTAAPPARSDTPKEDAPAPSWDANALTVGSLILLYGVFITAISSWLLSRGRSSDEVLRLMAVISAVIVSSFLLVVGYDDKQITPVIGLLGTIVGYLLGKEHGVLAGAQRAEDRKPDEEQTPNPAST